MKRHRTLTATRQQEDNQSNQPTLFQRDDCKTRKDNKQCITIHTLTALKELSQFKLKCDSRKLYARFEDYQHIYTDGSKENT